MGTISKIHYEETDVDIREAGKFYYYHNLINASDRFHKDYEEAEIKQLELRNKIISEAKKRGDIDHVRVDSSMLAISSIKNKVVLVADM